MGKSVEGEGEGEGGLTLTLVGWSDNRFIKGEEEKGGFFKREVRILLRKHSTYRAEK